MRFSSAFQHARLRGREWSLATIAVACIAIAWIAACGPISPTDGKSTNLNAPNPGGVPLNHVGDCEGEAKGPLHWVSGPTDSHGEIEIEKEEADDQEFEVKVDDLLADTTYVVCVQCLPLKPAAKSSSGAGTAAVGATLSMPHVSGAPGSMVNVPVRVETTHEITFASFVVEYRTDHVHLVSATVGSDAFAQNFTDLSFNSSLPFSTTTPGLNGHVAIQISNPNGVGTLSGNHPLEVVQLQFEVQNRPGESSAIAFDTSVPVGLPRTFVEVVPVTTLTGVASLGFNNGSITILGGGDTFDCGWTIHTDAEGDGKLELKTEHGDLLPCGVATVCELQSIGSADRLVEVHLGDASGPVVLRGVVPRFEADDDDDDDHHDGDGDDDDGHHDHH